MYNKFVLIQLGQCVNDVVKITNPGKNIAIAINIAIYLQYKV